MINPVNLRSLLDPVLNSPEMTFHVTLTRAHVRGCICTCVLAIDFGFVTTPRVLWQHRGFCTYVLDLLSAYFLAIYCYKHMHLITRVYGMQLLLLVFSREILSLLISLFINSWFPKASFPGAILWEETKGLVYITCTGWPQKSDSVSLLITSYVSLVSVHSPMQLYRNTAGYSAPLISFT